MALLSSLSDNERLVIADTSAIINLNATRCAEKLLRALPFRVVVVNAVQYELHDDEPKDRKDKSKFNDLVKEGLIEVVSLDESALQVFEALVIGEASETLDDGEAATIAFAASMNALAVIDERKALRLCAARYPEVRAASTVDLLAHPAVLGTLGPAALADAVYSALLDARMRVLPHHLDGVIELIGRTRAAQCKSLPRLARSRADVTLANQKGSL